MDEVGSILPTDWHPDTPYDPGPTIPAVYWQASGAVYAYVYLEAAKLGIDVVGESQLVGYPSQFPSVTMVDWTTGKPNARLEVLRLLREHLSSGDRMMRTKFIGSDVDAQAFDSNAGKKLVVVNKRNRSVALEIPEELTGAAVEGGRLEGRTLSLQPFAVAVVSGR